MTRQHPCSPLTAHEIERVAGIVRSDTTHTVGERTRFVLMEVREPDKEVAAAAELADESPPRDVRVILLDRDALDGAGTTYEVTVRLDDDTVVDWREIRGVQPLSDVKELSEAEDLLRDDPTFQAALRRRGVTDFSTVQVDAWPGGNFGRPEEQTTRLARCVAFVRPHGEDNEWAHPVDGIIALVDLNRLEVIRVDDHGAVPIPTEPGEFGDSAGIAPRTDLKPFEITQPEGPSFTVDGYTVEWQRWRIEVGFNPREGLVLHRVGYHDQGRLRPILHRASLAEMVVPYGDPSPTHYFKNAFDSGENGVGLATVSLTLGCDCLGEIHYFDAAVCDAAGKPVTISNAICMHEEDVGVLWRHVQWRTGEGTVRRSRRLVISSFAGIGNYDYGFFWYFYQDGTIEYEVKLTGVLSTGALPPGIEPAHGVLVAPELNAMLHQHYFCMRLNFAVDGEANIVEEVTTESTPAGPDNPYGNAFAVRRRLLETEQQALRNVDLGSARFWEVLNPRVRHRLGRPVAYRLVPGENTRPFAQPDAPVRKRAWFINQHLAVTPFDRDERFPAGDYPNQSPGGDGLERWTQQDRSLVNEDIVVWYTFGHHHVPRPEDWPVMPVATIGFKLKPVGFFERNPALDVPAPKPHCAHDPEPDRTGSPA
jgi:primary-amine oxidase